DVPDRLLHGRDGRGSQRARGSRPRLRQPARRLQRDRRDGAVRRPVGPPLLSLRAVRREPQVGERTEGQATRRARGRGALKEEPMIADSRVVYLFAYVADLERSRAFYEDTLGLSVIEEDSSSVKYDAGEVIFALN